MALFRPYGKVDSLRFRSFAVESSKISKSEAFRRRQFAAQKQFMNAYVVFAKEDAARKAAAAVNGARLTVRFNPHELKQAQKNKTAGTNATVWEGLSEVPGGYSHNITTVLRCDLASGASYVSSRCIFVGNVPFTGVNEQDMWKLFAKCGKIENVRMVRDKWTGVGKGFCYVQFEKEDSVLKAVELNQHNETKPIIRIGKKKFDVGCQPPHSQPLNPNRVVFSSGFFYYAPEDNEFNCKFAPCNGCFDHCHIGPLAVLGMSHGPLCRCADLEIAVASLLSQETPGARARQKAA